MAIPKKIVKFLEQSKVQYETIQHHTVYTAFDKAATLKVPQNIIAKTLVVTLDKKPVLVVIPANKNLDIQKFKKIAKVSLSSGAKANKRQINKINFATEAWMKKNLKGVKTGAVPPFGNLWGLPTFIDKTLLRNSKIIVNAGDYEWSIKINPVNFKKLIPGLTIGNFSKTKK